MADLEIKIDDLHASGGAAQQVAKAVRGIDVVTLSEAASSMAGSRAAGLFGQVESKLAKQVTNIADGFAALGSSLHDAANLYESNEQAASEALGGIPSSAYPKPR